MTRFFHPKKFVFLGGVQENFDDSSMNFVKFSCVSINANDHEFSSSALVSSANTAAVAPLPRPRKSISPSDSSLAASGGIETEGKTPEGAANPRKPSAKPRKL